MNTWNLWRVRM